MREVKCTACMYIQIKISTSNLYKTPIGVVKDSEWPVLRSVNRIIRISCVRTNFSSDKTNDSIN